MRKAIWLTLFLCGATLIGGCGTIGTPEDGITLDIGRIGSGQQAVYPTNSEYFWNGNPID